MKVAWPARTIFPDLRPGAVNLAPAVARGRLLTATYHAPTSRTAFRLSGGRGVRETRISFPRVAVHLLAPDDSGAAATAVAPTQNFGRCRNANFLQINRTRNLVVRSRADRLWRRWRRRIIATARRRLASPGPCACPGT